MTATASHILVVMGYEAVTWSGAETTVPDLVRRVYERAGSQSQSFRLRRNHVAFLVADKARVASMRDAQIRRLALADLLRQDVMQQLAPHQQQKLQEEHKRSEQELGTSIQNAYRHLFYPSRAGLEDRADPGPRGDRDPLDVGGAWAGAKGGGPHAPGGKPAPGAWRPPPAAVVRPGPHASAQRADHDSR